MNDFLWDLCLTSKKYVSFPEITDEDTEIWWHAVISLYNPQ